MIRFASTCYTSVKQLKHSLVPRSVICLPFGPPSFLKLLTATYQGGKQHVRGEVNLLPQVYEHYLCTDSSKGLVLYRSCKSFSLCLAQHSQNVVVPPQEGNATRKKKSKLISFHFKLIVFLYLATHIYC